MSKNKEIKEYEYHIALSFAGEEREYVEEVAQLLKSYGVSVFYDNFEKTTLWGKNLLDYLQKVYKEKAQYTIMFISKHYAKKIWTTHERKSMQERAFKESEEYILPVRFDETEIPGLHETISYVDIKDKKPYDLTELILQKINWKTKEKWFGVWDIEITKFFKQGSMLIYNVNSNEFSFEITVQYGSYIGEIKGKAKILSKNEAEYISEEVNEDKGNCVIKFTRSNDIIQIKESRGCLDVMA